MNQHAPEHEPVEAIDSHHAADDTAVAATSPAATVPPFNPQRFQMQLWLDRVLRWAIIVGAMVAIAAAFTYDVQGTFSGLLAIVLLMAAWMGININSARASRELAQITAAVEVDAVAAEGRIAYHLSRRPLLPWVRLALYHRLASLRHRQQRFDEAAAICGELLRYPNPAAIRTGRPHLLLMLTEASLECQDLLSAWFALTELYQTRLTLLESLQRMALQMRYEIMAGYNDAALSHTKQKIQLAELMPAPQCGAVHAMLATAATHSGMSQLAQWLWLRAELLCTDEQLAQLRENGFRIAVVKTPEPPTIAN